nr:hypothetical protein [Tanacetum cinerariifolium]
MGTHDDEAGSSRSKRPRQHETVEEEGCNRDAKSRYNTRLGQLLPRHIYSPCIVNWDVLKRMGCNGEIDDMLRIKLHEVGSDEEIFTSVAWIISFNINEPIYAELYHEFYSTYGFDEVCADDELQTRGKPWFISKSYFYYQEPNFEVIHKMITYGLCQRTTGYDKIQKNDLWHLSMFDARHQNRYANVAWVNARWIKKKGAGTQKESKSCCGHFISNIARRCRVLTEDVVRSLSALIYCRELYTITFKYLIDSDFRLIREDPQPGVPRVGIPRPPRTSMQDLYEAIERMKYRQSYH